MNNTCFVPPSSKVAFVTGVNGISGHAIVERLIRTPKSEWSKIIVTSRRPLDNYWIDPRVQFVALDFLQSKDSIVEKIKTICKDVTHAYFTSYIHDNDFFKLGEKNGPLFRNFLEAIDEACPELQRVCLQTGGKHYGFQFREFKTPFFEDTPRLEGPGSESIFYYEQEDDMIRIQERRNVWKYNVIRPMGIIGFTPQFSGMNEAIPIAQYFLICRELGENPKWPGNLKGFNRVEDQSYAPSIADLTVWATTQERCQNEAFNHTNGDSMAWKFLWTLFGKYFNIEIDAFPDSIVDTSKPQIDLGEWAKDKEGVWKSIVAKYGGRAESFQICNFEFMNWGFTPASQNRLFMSTVNKARRFGWDRIDDSYQAWIDTFQSYENAGILPSHHLFQY